MFESGQMRYLLYTILLGRNLFVTITLPRNLGTLTGTTIKLTGVLTFTYTQLTIGIFQTDSTIGECEDELSVLTQHICPYQFAIQRETSGRVAITEIGHLIIDRKI